MRDLLAQHHVGPLTPPPAIRPALVSLGRDLFFDKVLSGSFDTACDTCHNPGFGMGDALPVFAGVNGSGLSLARMQSGAAQGPRHSQNLNNLHLLDKGLAIDGKVEMNDQGMIITLGLPLIPPQVQAQFEFGIITAQAMMPEATPREMLGFPGDNDLANCPPFDLACAWQGYMVRLMAIPEYVTKFQAAYPGVPQSNFNFAMVGNAIAAWQIVALFFNDTPFDRFLAGDDCAMTIAQVIGAERFYNPAKGNCVACHAGGLMSDKLYHKTLTPQFGPGNTIPFGDGPGGLDDFGRMRNTGNIAEKYAWRTTPLRNNALDGPYGRLGQFATIENHIRHYENPVQALRDYDITQVVDQTLWNTLLNNTEDVISNGYDPILDTVTVRNENDVKELADFMSALTSERKRNLRPPASVPSGLPVD